MPSRLVESKKKYLLRSYIGNNNGIVGELKSKFWEWKVGQMSEGEILKRYYELTNGRDDMSLCLKD